MGRARSSPRSRLPSVGAPVVFAIDEGWMNTDALGGYGPPVSCLIDASEITAPVPDGLSAPPVHPGGPFHYELIVAANGSG